MPIIIAVAGVSGSGKTTVLKKLQRYFGGTDLSSDWYYNDNSHLSKEQRDILNFDIPEGIGFAELASDLQKLSTGQNALVPQYDFHTHTRKTEKKAISADDIFFVDGILILHALPDSFSFKVYVDAPDEIARERRIARDIAERGRTREQAEKQYEATVRPSQEIYVKPFNDPQKVDFIVKNGVNLPHDSANDIPLDLTNLIDQLTLVIAKMRATETIARLVPAYAATSSTFFTAASSAAPAPANDSALSTSQSKSPGLGQ
jgi:uridine kinase